MNKKNGNIIVISAPSGGGKTTLCSILLKMYPSLKYSISTTTREKRIGEIDREDYIFVSKKEFKKMISENKFIEWSIVHNNYYGTSKEYIKKIISRGQYCILDIDVIGGRVLKNKFPCGIFIFVMPESLSKLEYRLRMRKTDSNETIRLRMKNARAEIRYKDDYEYIITNAEMSNTVKKASDIIEKRCPGLKKDPGINIKELLP